MSAMSYLEFVNLPLFVILEFIHVFLELRAFCFRLRLLCLGRLDGLLQLDDGLLQILNLGADLMPH